MGRNGREIEKRSGGKVREIIFRGKQKYGGQWVYGHLAEIETAWDRYEYGSLPTEYEEVIIRTDFLTREPVAIIPETVGQYTGLEDKNGVKIFEGDVIRSKYANAKRFEFTETVVFRGGKFCAEYKTSEDGRFYAPLADGVQHLTMDKSVYMESCVVIGNIHDNPELLK